MRDLPDVPFSNSLLWFLKTASAASITLVAAYFVLRNQFENGDLGLFFAGAGAIVLGVLVFGIMWWRLDYRRPCPECKISMKFRKEKDKRSFWKQFWNYEDAGYHPLYDCSRCGITWRGPWRANTEWSGGDGD